jgi:hypothetical protein
MPDFDSPNEVGDTEDFDYEEDEDGQPQDSNNTKESKDGKEDKQETKGESTDDDLEDGEDDSDTSTSLDRYKKSTESESDQFAPDCRTDDSYRKNENSLLDDKCKPYVYVDIPEAKKENIFTPAKRVQELMTEYYQERMELIGSFNNDYIQKAVNDFKNKNERYVGLLAKEFEMRKAAKAFSKSKLSDTGDIDINKLCNYKFDDNIFRKVMMIPKGKSHGLILLLDCSGSMSDNMAGSIEQILVLSMFCRKVNIPFRVFGFTDDMGTFKMDRNIDYVTDKDYFSFSKKAGQLNFSNVQLREYLNSKMSNVEFTKSLRNMVLLKESYSYGRGYSVVGRPTSESLSNTPLIQAIVAVGSILNEFRTTNNIDLTSLIIVHDGDADSTNYRAIETEMETHAGTKTWMSNEVFDSRYANVILRDPKNKFEYQLKNSARQNYQYATNEQLLLGVLEWIRVVGKTKVFGFFILPSRPSHAKAAIRNRFFFENGLSIQNMRNEPNMNAWDKEKELIKKFKDEKFLISNTKGYNSFYLISGGASLKTEEEELEIDGKVTSGKLKNAFMKMTKKKQVNRVLVSKFIQQMAV